MDLSKGPLRWGFLSTGNICHDFVSAMSLLDPNQHSPRAVAGRSLESARKFANEHKIPKFYGTYEELYSDPDLDVIYIGTINPFHLATARDALNHGKNVIVEKPMGMNSRETSELIDLAKSKGLFLMEGIWSRCFPAYKALKDDVISGRIGDVKNVLITFGSASNRPRTAKMDLGGGGLLDKGIYSIQLLTHLFGSGPLKVQASGILNEEGVDKNISATLTFPGDILATLLISTEVKMSNQAILYGTKGTLTMNSFWCPNSYTITQLPSNEIITREFPLPGAPPEKKFMFINSSGFTHEIEEVRRCLANGLKESPLMSLEETLLIAGIMEDIRKEIGMIYPQDK